LSAPDIALAFVYWLWHKTAVPVFLEKFMLPLFATVMVLVAITNPMKFDMSQRVAGTLALIFAAYFVAHTIHKERAEPRETHIEQQHIEPLTLKGLFLTDFGPQLNRARWDDRSLTIGSKTNAFPEMTMTFTPQLWMNLHEGSEFLGFYIPIQDKDPDEASKKTVRLCHYLPDQFPAILKMLQSLEISVPNTKGSMVKSTDLSLSRRVYIYHEDFISPPDLGDLVREYEARQWVVEFRGHEYLSTQELLRRK
jgi:hypothetical protein